MRIEGRVDLQFVDLDIDISFCEQDLTSSDAVRPCAQSSV